jgi:hypothetical protein
MEVECDPHEERKNKGKEAKESWRKRTNEKGSERNMVWTQKEAASHPIGDHDLRV